MAGIYSSLCLITITLLNVIFSNAVVFPTEVQTSEGKLIGAMTETIRYFKTVPYAQPPVGNLRFQPPKRVQAYEGGVYHAYDWRMVECLQPNSEHGSEDCLYLDIYTPLEASKNPEGYPVHVFIHGGAFVLGSKEQYPNTALAQAGVVSVVINYRLGLLAYLKTSDSTPAYNGFLDQQLALKWVQKNIAAFGGNAKIVTIHGQSAGANSVLLHVMSPMSGGLFHRAIAQSSMAQSYYPTRVDAIETAKVLYELLGCPIFDVECTQLLPVEKIAEVATQYTHLCQTNQVPYYAYDLDKSYWFCGLAPEVGNTILPSQPYNQFKIGMINKVPMIVGTVWNEGLIDSDATYNPVREQAPSLYTQNKIEETEKIYKLFLNQIVDHRSYEENLKNASEKLLSTRARAIYQYYPYRVNDGFEDMYYNGYNGFDPKKPERLDASYVYHSLYHDKWYHCPGRNLLRTLYKKLRGSTPNIFVYRFKQPLSTQKETYKTEYKRNPVTAVNDNFWSYNLYPTHGDDLFFFLGLIAFQDTNDAKLQSRMFAAVLNFIYTGNPNEGPYSKAVGRRWRVYDPMEDNLIILAEPDKSSYSAKNVREKQCSYWDRTGYTF